MLDRMPASNDSGPLFEAVCTALVKELRTGGPRRTEDFLRAHPTLAADPDQVLELIYTEFVARLELGTVGQPEDWFARFPHYGQRLERLLLVHEVFCARDPRRALPREAEPAVGGTLQASSSSYELLEPVGRGVTSIVYKARQRAPVERLVALKTLHAGRVAEPAEIARFLREARAASALGHPNIVPVYEVGQNDDRLYYTMPLVAGGNLAAQRARIGADLRGAVRLVEKVARAVQHAHEHGIWHRDLKPANILLDEHDEPLVADFGVAKVQDEGSVLTKTGEVVGTPAHLSPEQAAGRGDAVGPASDVWGLGVLLYELLTGRLPFVADTREELLHQICQEPPLSPRTLRPELPPALEAICLQCLEKEPRDRYPTARAFADDLSHWLRGEQVTARPIGRLRHAWRRCRARLDRAVLLQTLGLVGMLVLILLLARQWFFPSQSVVHRSPERRQADAAAELVRRQFTYGRQLREAQRALQAGDWASVHSLLRSQQPGPGEADLREFAWHWLAEQARRPLGLHHGEAWSVAFSPDGRWLASGGDDHLVRLWDVASGQQLQELGHDSLVTTVAFSPAGDRLASCSFDATVRLWDPRTGELKRTLSALGRKQRALLWSADGQSVLAAGEGGVVRVWDAETGVLRWAGPDQPKAVSRLALMPDGRRLAGNAPEGAVSFWNLEEGREAAAWEQTGKVRSLAVAPDGRYLAVGTADGLVQLRDVHTGQARHTLRGHTHEVWALAFSPDGRTLASAGLDRTIRIWDLRTNIELLLLEGHEGQVNALAFSPDGSRLASAGHDGRVLLWEAPRR